jgi:DinB family protein
MGVSEPEAYREQFEKIAEQAKSLTEELSEAQFNWGPKPGEWSIQECLAHLIIVGQQEIKLIESAVQSGRQKGITGVGPFRYGFLERAILRQTEPPVRRKFTAPARFRPVDGQPLTAIVPTFLHLQSQLGRIAGDCEGLDLARVKVATPITRWLKFSLGITLAQTAAHERRHLEQARRVREHSQFPMRP